MHVQTSQPGTDNVLK